MSNDKNFFKTLNTCTNESITLANDDSAEVQGIGDDYLTCKDNKGKQNAIMVKEVLYVLTLGENLLSVRKLTEKGLQVKFTEKMCNIMKDDITVTTADLSDNLYRLWFDHKVLMIVNKHRKDCQPTWHRKLGHRDAEAVKQMKTKDLVTGLEITDCGIKSVCEICIKGKMTKRSFSKESYHNTQEPLDLIHTDVCGPVQTVILGKKRYILTLIDDYSKYTVVYLMEHKSEVTEKTQEYINNMKTKFKKVPKIIRSDQGKEYLNASLKNFLRKEGIEMQYIMGYAPEQNGTENGAERKNRYLMEIARCMLIDANLKMVQEEAVFTIYTYIRL